MIYDKKFLLALDPPHSILLLSSLSICKQTYSFIPIGFLSRLS
jgi:hypothetical protein